jgi:hypothetical protein
MKKVLLGILGLVVLAGAGMGVWIATATNVRQVTQHASLTPDGKAKKARTADALDYAVATRIAAPPDVVWKLLADVGAQKEWNSTLTSIEGNVALGSRVKMTTKLGGDRVFDLAVTTFEAPSKMVWEDGNKMFMGVRTYSVTADGDGSIFAMNETLSGRMLAMIEPSMPDFGPSFETYAADLKKAAEARAPAPAPAAAPAP